MSNLPANQQFVSEIFNFALDGRFKEPVKNDYQKIISWISQIVIKSDPKQTIPPTNIRLLLDNITGCNDMQFQIVKQMVRNDLNILVNGYLELIDSKPITSCMELVLNGIYNSCEILKKCYKYLDLSSLQILLMERLENSIYQLAVTYPSFWEGIRSLYDRALFDSSGEQLQHLLDISDLLDKIDLGNELTMLLLDVTRNHIKNRVRIFCISQWDTNKLAPLLKWIEDELYPTLAQLIPNNDFNLEFLVSMAKVELVQLRTRELFDIVLDYPDSQCALKEFRESLTTPDQSLALVNTFITQCKDRLLHAGADTIDIIMCYISTVKSFLIIDHRGVLLDKASRPIRNYLKGRPDTIQQIVHAFLDTTPKNRLIELAIELRNNGKSPVIAGDCARDINWTPDPVDALPDFRKAVVEDTVESLISIFDSKEPFISEFVKVFSGILLNITNYDIRGVYNDIHMLKIHFGSHEFSKLDVMLKDMLLSKSIERKFKHFIPKDVHASIISHLYWPKLPSYNFNMPPEIQKPFDAYKDSFEKVKRGRKLVLCPSLCKASLDIEIGGQTRHFDVSADKASLIYFFQSQHKPVKLAIICMQLKMPLILVKGGLKYWTQQGILAECGLNTYVVNE